ncbi:hypothetical protein TNO006_40192 [Tenacibaculum finnmarkense]|nr:hypothetical protein TNO006_40192 [Tenacibaculum finnmarkense]
MLPLTPIAPISTPSEFFIGMPPAKVIMPLLECSILYKGCPGCDNVPRTSVFLPNKAAVFAFFMAISIGPKKAPSMRSKATKFVPASTTEILILVFREIAFIVAVASTFFAWLKVMFIELNFLDADLDANFTNFR